MIWLGGACWTPSALLKRESTTTILRNDVKIMTIKGSNEKSVRATAWLIKEGRLKENCCWKMSNSCLGFAGAATSASWAAEGTEVVTRGTGWGNKCSGERHNTPINANQHKNDFGANRLRQENCLLMLFIYRTRLHQRIEGTLKSIPLVFQLSIDDPPFSFNNAPTAGNISTFTYR